MTLFQAQLPPRTQTTLISSEISNICQTKKQRNQQNVIFQGTAVHMVTVAAAQKQAPATKRQKTKN